MKNNKLLREFLQMVTIGFMLMLFVGCEGETTEPMTQKEFDLSDEGDPDMDGLSNADEKRYGTSIFLADTDGDGRSDNTEAKEGDYKTYNAALISAFPNLKVSLASPIKLYLDYTTTEGENKTDDYGLTTTDSLSTSASRSSMESTALTHGWNLDTTISFGLSGGVTFGLGYNGQQTTDTSTTTDIGRIRDISKSIDERISNTKSFDQTYSNAQLKFTIKIKNMSRTLGLNASGFNVNIVALNGGRYVVLGAGSVSDGKNDSAVLQPGEETNEMEFVANITGQEYEYIKGLNSGAFDISLAAVNIDGITVVGSSGFQNTYDIATIYTNMQNRTSLAEINYFDGNTDPKKISISSSRKYDEKGDYIALTMFEWLDVAGTVNLEFDEVGTLKGIDDVKVYEDALWNISVYELNDKAKYEIQKSITSNHLNFMKTYKMQAGLKVIFSRGVDPDKDGIISYYETYKYKTDPDKFDTDGDGIGDRDELIGYYPEAISTVGTEEKKFKSLKRFVANPLTTDSDSDKINDASDLFPLVKLMSDYANLDTNASLSYEATRQKITFYEDEEESKKSRLSIKNVKGNISFKIPCKEVETSNMDEKYLRNILTISNQQANKMNFTLDGKVSKVVLSRKILDFERIEGDSKVWEELYLVSKTINSECSYLLRDENIQYLGDYQYKIDIYSYKNSFYGENPKKSFYVAANFQGEVSPVKVVNKSIDRYTADGSSEGSLDYQFQLQIELDARYEKVNFIDYATKRYEIKYTKEKLANGKIRYTSDIIRRSRINTMNDHIGYEVFDSNDNKIIAKFANVNINLVSYDMQYHFLGLSGWSNSMNSNELSGKTYISDMNEARDMVNGPMKRSMNEDGKGYIVTDHFDKRRYEDMTILGTSGVSEVWNSKYSGNDKYKSEIKDIRPTNTTDTVGFILNFTADYVNDKYTPTDFHERKFVYVINSNMKSEIAPVENYSYPDRNNTSIRIGPNENNNNKSVYYYKVASLPKAHNDAGIGGVDHYIKFKFIPKIFSISLTSWENF